MAKLPLFGKLPENGKILSNVTQQRLLALTLASKWGLTRLFLWSRSKVISTDIYIYTSDKTILGGLLLYLRSSAPAALHFNLKAECFRTRYDKKHTCHIPISCRRPNCRGNFTPEFLIVGLIVGVNKKFHAGFSNCRAIVGVNFTPKFQKSTLL